MRDSSSGRGYGLTGFGLTGFDRVVMAIAATLLLATSAQAQSAKTPAELAIDAAVPVPEPANVPPPTAADFKAEPAKTETPKTETTAAAPSAPSAEPAKKGEAASTPPAPAPAAVTSAPPAKPTASVASADQPAADKILELLGAKATKFFDRKNERVAVDAFYKDRSYAPLWTEAGALNTRAKAVIEKLKDAGADGLNPGDYPVPDFAAATTPDALADADLKLTASILDYARHAQSGRMHWSRISADILFPEHAPDPAEILVNVSTARNAKIALDSYNPQHKGYQALKAKLAELRGSNDGPANILADGETLKFVKPTKKNATPAVMEDPRVPQLRAKLGITENASDTHYDAKVADAVRKFQSDNELKVTGALDNATVRALNGPKRDKQIDTVRVNMERWRWLPRELGAPSVGNAYVMLNIPDYTLKVMQNGAQVWTTRVVVGKPGKATPELTETMKYITVNPTWNVPPSIIYNEYLPALQQDPTVLDRMGLRLERNRDGSIHISQPPGEANALGRIRFNFPNKFLVYQHDTPDKYLFAKDERAYSHGCMRVQNPDQYAAVLLNITSPKENYTAEKIRAMYGRGEITLNFPTPIPVNITYQTAFVDDAGHLQFRKDIYGRDSRILAVLRGDGRDAEVAVAHAQPNYVRPAGNISIPGERYASNGPSFFERLFGPPMPPPQPIRGQSRRAPR